MTIVHSLFDLSGKTALVVGGGGDLGGEMAVALGEAGADVAIADVDEAGARRTAERIEALGRRALVLRCDATSSQEVQRTIDKVVSEFGSLNISVNSQGVGDHAATMEMPEELWDKVLSVNLSSIFLCTKYQGCAMRNGEGGSIINVASMHSIIAAKGVALGAYCSSKGGLLLLTKSLACEWAPYDIRVNCISPGEMITKMNKASYDPESQVYKDLVGRTPLGRMGAPHELKGAVVFLASEASSFVTGSNLVIDGGYSIW